MAEEMGIALMFCTPPATTTSAVPDMTACAAKCTACCDEPHCRSTVTPGTSEGSPAASQHVLAMSPACGPIVSTHPKITSDTTAGSTGTRSNSARRTCAPRSPGCTADTPPPRRPTGVRTASTMKASATVLGYQASAWVGEENHERSLRRGGGMTESRGKPSERRADLVRIAAELFAERGYRATTVRHIGDAAGVLSGSLYHHFDSKETILDELLSSYLNELVETYREITAGVEPVTALRGLVTEAF